MDGLGRLDAAVSQGFLTESWSIESAAGLLGCCPLCLGLSGRWAAAPPVARIPQFPGPALPAAGGTAEVGAFCLDQHVSD